MEFTPQYCGGCKPYRRNDILWGRRWIYSYLCWHLCLNIYKAEDLFLFFFMEQLHQSSEDSFQNRFTPPILSITQKELEYIFIHSRSKETSLDPDFWGQATKDRSQCLPTTFVVQTLCWWKLAAKRFLIKDIFTQRIRKIPHFFNIVDEKHIDFTGKQMIHREHIKNARILHIGNPAVLRNQNKEDYYAFFADIDIQTKEALLFENVKKAINTALNTDLERYLAAWKKIQLLQ